MKIIKENNKELSPLLTILTMGWEFPLYFSLWLNGTLAV